MAITPLTLAVWALCVVSVLSQCDPRINCTSSGVCIVPPQNGTTEHYHTSPVCECEDGVVTRRDSVSEECNYTQKSLRTAFFLSLFLGFWGAGYFYTEHTAMGAGIVSLFVFLIIIPVIGIIYTKRMHLQRDRSRVVTIVKNILRVAGLAFVAWWAASWATLFTRWSKNDAQGYPLHGTIF